MNISTLTFAAYLALLLLLSPAQAREVPPVPSEASQSAGASSLGFGATDYTDGWWVPTESGWGVSVLHQGNSMALVFYVYGENSEARWYLASAGYVSETAGFQGLLTYHTGTPFGQAVFGPIQLNPQPVGTVTFRPTSPYDAQLTYTVGNTVVSKNLTRVAFDNVNFAGSFIGGVAGTVTGCAGGSAQIFERAISISTSVVNSFAQIVMKDAVGTCTISGSVRQRGKLASIENGIYSCTSGISGSATVDEWDRNQSGMTARYGTQTGTCVEEARISGARRP